jgi:hypothetical protein
MKTPCMIWDINAWWLPSACAVEFLPSPPEDHEAVWADYPGPWESARRPGNDHPSSETAGPPPGNILAANKQPISMLAVMSENQSERQPECQSSHPHLNTFLSLENTRREAV